MKQKNFFKLGFKGMLPITTGIIPFGAVMGSVGAEAKLSFFQSGMMNVLVFAGASQLAAIDLMKKNAASFVVVLTGLIINLRFLLYSAALSPLVQRCHFLVKFFCAYSLTDQNYAVMSAHQNQLHQTSDAIQFYLGASVCMILTWHLSVWAGFIFGNFAPASLALDFAVPLSFISLTFPALQNKNHVIVAGFSSLVSLAMHPLPYKAGLLATALLSLALALFLTRKRIKGT